MYQENKDRQTGRTVSIKRVSDGAVIPIAPGNRDYEEYVTWLAAGNTPLPDPEWTLANVRVERVKRVNAEANSRIGAKWPVWLQNNIALGLDPLLAQSCKDDVSAVRVASNTASDLVNTAPDIPAVHAVLVNWPVI